MMSALSGFLFLAMSGFFLMVNNCKGDPLVSNTDFKIARDWVPKKICGRDFWFIGRGLIRLHATINRGQAYENKLPGSICVKFTRLSQAHLRTIRS